MDNRTAIQITIQKAHNGLWFVLVNGKIARRLSSKPAAEKSAAALATYFGLRAAEDVS